MGSYANQSLFDYGAAVFAALALLGHPIDKSIRKALPAYLEVYTDDQTLHDEWLKASEAMVTIAQSLFDEPDLQIAFLRAFQWYVQNYDQEGKRFPFYKKIFRGAWFTRSTHPIANRVENCLKRATAYAIRLRLGTAPLPNR